MLPLILPTDKLIVGKIGRIKVDDIVVFERRGRLIAHRVLYIYPGGKAIVTKGDNNYSDDGSITTNRILGSVRKIKREGKIVHINHYYLSQSLSYLREVTKLIRGLRKKGVESVILKGVPVHFYIESSFPKRLLVDLDLLVSPKDFGKAKKTILNLGFKESNTKKFKDATQSTFYADILPYPVQIDLHKEAAVGFTKLPKVNDIFLNLDNLNHELFKNTHTVKIEKFEFKILDKNYLAVYLLLHFFHHNFKGASRMELISKLFKKGISLTEVVKIVKRNSLSGLIFPGVKIINKYYPSQDLNNLQDALNIPFHQKFMTFLLTKFLNPFNEDRNWEHRIKRLFFIVIFS